MTGGWGSGLNPEAIPKYRPGPGKNCLGGGSISNELLRSSDALVKGQLLS